jgi:hypothetical protein
MSITLTNNYNNIPVTYEGKSRSSICKTDGTGTTRFDRALVSTATLPSFIGKVYTREELMQAVDDEVQRNQSKKMSLDDMIKKSCFEGTRARFCFAGESKMYAFDEYIQELEKRFKQNS